VTLIFFQRPSWYANAAVFATRTPAPGEFHPFLKNKIKYFLSNKVDYKNYAGNVTLIPWFMH